MQYVYAAAPCVAYVNGLRIQLETDDVWDADDPVVKARPDLFRATPVKVNRTVPVSPPVEQATAAPGEKRGARRV